MESLQNIFDKNECDKGSLKHRYDRVYEPALAPFREEPIRVLEIGVFKGASLASWVDYLPNAQITGIDIFTRVKPEDIEILEHPRVQWCYCDSLEGPSEEFKALATDKFDFIIDDGLHTHEAITKSFLNFIPFLKDDGVYFMEDVWPFDQMTKKQKNHRWIKTHPGLYTDEKYSELLAAIEPYDCKFHDIREGYGLDTYIIEIRKDK